ncbi:MAG TPA: hypothetical protein VGN84_01870 [Solirubrobacterales bacterium]|jgi:hypothetical protein|nr:hypothetical protein [Solirubrobacterales bacterium]
MSELANRKPPQLLSPFWPLEDQHGVGHVRLEGEAPHNTAQAMPLLLRLAAQSEAMRSLQSAEGADLSESAASVLRGEMAEGLRELADLVDTDSAEVIRLRAKGLEGGIGHREMTLEIARGAASPALEIVCGPLCTWRMKTRIGLHSFLAAARDKVQQDLLDQLDASLDDALRSVEAEIGAKDMGVPFKLPMNVTDLLISAGESAGHPKHFAYFMPEDEGIDGLPLEEQRTLYMRNVHLARYSVITIPLAETLLDGPMAAGDVPVEATLMPWIRGHDHGHNVIVPSTTYESWMETLGVEPFMALQEAIADVYGFLMCISEPWLRIGGFSRLEMCATHMSELLHYLRRGPQYFGDPGAAYVELSFLAENGFVEIDEGGRIRWNEEDFCRGMAALASALTESTVGAPDESGSEAFLARYGWPTETAAKRTLDAMRRELASVPTSIAFYRTSDVTASQSVPVPA